MQHDRFKLFEEDELQAIRKACYEIKERDYHWEPAKRVIDEVTLELAKRS
jgi:hypothetical protein